MLNCICNYKEYIFRTIKPFRTNQTDVIKNSSVVTCAVIKRVDCITVSVIN